MEIVEMLLKVVGLIVMWSICVSLVCTWFIVSVVEFRSSLDENVEFIQNCWKLIRELIKRKEVESE